MYTTVAQRGWVDPTDIMRWTPQGYQQTALDMEGEPLRTYSPYGVRGSQKYPFGKAFKEAWEIDGWDHHLTPGLAVAALLLLLLI